MSVVARRHSRPAPEYKTHSARLYASGRERNLLLIERSAERDSLARAGRPAAAEEEEKGEDEEEEEEATTTTRQQVRARPTSFLGRSRARARARLRWAGRAGGRTQQARGRTGSQGNSNGILDKQSGDGGHSLSPLARNAGGLHKLFWPRALACFRPICARSAPTLQAKLDGLQVLHREPGRQLAGNRE